MAERKPNEPGLIRLSELARRSGVPASTIKHYVRLGLVPPPRSRPNRQMAYYDEGLVDRVRAIKILQTERYLPLGTIARILGEPPRPGEKRAEALRARQLIALEPAVTTPTTRTMTRDEVLGAMKLSPRDLDELERRGLLSPAAGTYGDVDLEILQIIHDTRAAGLDELFPMAILEPFASAVRDLVRLEVDLFRQRLEATRPPAGVPLRDVAKAATQLGERLVVALRRKLVVARVRELAADKTPRPRPSTRGGRRR